MLTNEASFEERRFRMADVAVAGDKATKTPFCATADTNSVVWRLKPGQEIAPHMHTTSDDIWICLQGKGEFYPEKGVKKPIQAGDVIVSPRSTCHGMINTGDEDFIFVGILAPVPSDFQAL